VKYLSAVDRIPASFLTVLMVWWPLPAGHSALLNGRLSLDSRQTALSTRPAPPARGVAQVLTPLGGVLMALHSEPHH